MKRSTNLEKLKEIGELALTKIADIELQTVETKKDDASRDLLKETNTLLKQLGSNKHFVEHDKDIKKLAGETFHDIQASFSFKKYLAERKARKKARKNIDKESYDFLKTTLLLEKYQEKKKENAKDMRKNFTLFLNPFTSSSQKEHLLLKKRVLQQNITLLKAKRNGGVNSYTDIKKGYKKILEIMTNSLSFLSGTMLFAACIYIGFFVLSQVSSRYDLGLLSFSPASLDSFIIFFALFCIFW